MPLSIHKDIETVDTISKKDFENNYMKPRKPLVIKNLYKGQPLLEKWTFDFFKETMGHHEIGLFDSAEQYTGQSFKYPPIKMKFAEYIDLILKGPTSLRIFLFNPFKLKPDLKKDFHMPDITDKMINLSFMFFGGQSSVTRIHYDMDMSHVFLTHLAGRKRVVLFPPDESELLYKLPFTVHSPIDIDHPDYESYPALNYVRGHECIIQNGETLFIPSGWWHHIEYLDAGFSVNYRAPGSYMRGLWNVLVVHHLDELLIKTAGDRWFNYKEKTAKEKAKSAIQSLVQE